MHVLEVGTYKGLVRGEMKIKKASSRLTLSETSLKVVSEQSRWKNMKKGISPSKTSFC